MSNIKKKKFKSDQNLLNTVKIGVEKSMVQFLFMMKKNSFSMNGFRKGKVLDIIIEKKFGLEIRDSAINFTLNQYANNHKEHKITKSVQYKILNKNDEKNLFFLEYTYEYKLKEKKSDTSNKKEKTTKTPKKTKPVNKKTNKKTLN